MSTAPAPHLLVVDDEPDLRTLYELTLLRAGYRVAAAATLQEARAELARQPFDAVLTDMRLPDGLGIELVRELALAQRREKVLVITAYGSAENAVEALKAGAYDYLTKPVDPKPLRDAVAAALRRQAPLGAGGPGAQATEPPMADGPGLAGAQALARLVGASAPMVALRQRIERVARSMAPVLVQGESGTGKELVARALHGCSQRADGPFVAVNCGAIPENLLEAEFFGVRKGAYTGASADRPGYFQAAQGGTLFLDEIGDLPLPMQAKLLRAIQERRVRPLGSAQEEAVDVRFVSATHRDLALAVRQNQFRQDLFYRLNVIELTLPPLRERRDDLPLLVHALLHRLCTDSGLPLATLADDALSWLQQQPLAGNVRELENILHRGLALSHGPVLQLPDLSEPHSGLAELGPADAVPAAAAPTPAPAPPLPASAPDTLLSYLDARERQVLQDTLAQAGGNPEQAAAALGMNRAQLQLRLRRLGLAVADPHAG